MQFISVFIMAFLGMMLFSGLSGMWYGVETYLANYQTNTNLAGVWVYSENFTAQDIGKVTQLTGVEAAQRRLRVTATESGVSETKLDIYFLENNAVNRPLVTEGAPVDPQDTASIWLDAEFAKASGLKVGDTFSFKIGNVMIEKNIAGIVYSSEQTYYRNSKSLFINHREVGFGYCSIAGFPIKAFLLDQLTTGDVDAEETLDDMLAKKYPEFVNSAVDQRYDELVDAMVEDDYEGLIDSLVDDHYDEMVDSLVEDRRDEIIDRYVDENYDEAIDRMVDENYDEILREYVEENYDTILEEYVTNNRESIIDTYVNENYYTILYQYIIANRDELIRTYVDENFDALVNEFIDENFDDILGQYVTSNRDALIRAYVDQNFDALATSYIDANFDSILTQYVSANRSTLIQSYVAANYDALVNQYIDQNYTAILDAIIHSLYTPEEIAASGLTMEELRQQILLTYSDTEIRDMAKQLITMDQVVAMVNASLSDDQLKQILLAQHGEDALKTQLKQQVTRDQVAAMVGASITHAQLKELVLSVYGEGAIKQTIKQGISKADVIEVVDGQLSNNDLLYILREVMTVDEVKKNAAKQMSNADLIEEAKERYSVEEVIDLIKSDYPADEVKEIVREEYSPDELKTEINERLSDDELKERIRESFTADDLKRTIKEEYTPANLKDAIKENYPPDEMKQKLLDEYSPEDMRDLILKKYPGDQLRDLLVDNLSAMDDRDFESDLVFNELLLVTDRTDLSALEQDLNQVTENDVVALLERGSVPGVFRLPERMEALKVISNMFPPVFIAIAILTITTTMSRMVVAQRTQIGILKALGYTRGKIIFHYLGYAFYASAAGSLLGVVIGPMIVPGVMFRPLSRVYTLPDWTAAIAPISWGIAAACILACTAACYFAVREILAEYPAEALRPKASFKFSLRSVSQNRIWQKLSFGVQWNIRDVFRSKVRSIMGIVGAMSSMALLLCGFALQDTFQSTMSWLYDDIQTYQTQILLVDNADLTEATALAQQVDGQLMMSSMVEIRQGANIKTAPLVVIEDSSQYQITDSNKRPLAMDDDDIAISRKIAATLGIKPGEQVIWRMGDATEWSVGTVTVLNITPMGQGMVMTRAKFEALNGKFTPTSIITNQAVESLPSNLVNAIYSKQDLRDSWNLSMESLMRITFILMAAAFILSVVVLYNLGLLSFSEKERELATLKVLGFKSRVIRRLLVTQITWVTIFGILLGIPAGGWLIRQIASFLGSDFDLIAEYSNASVVICAVTVLGISIITNLAFSTRLKRLDMVAAFKSVE